jgi:IstB-like ATP binding protein
MLRLPTVRTQLPELAKAAAREHMSYRGFLAELLMAECDDRARRRAERRIKAVAIVSNEPFGKPICSRQHVQAATEISRVRFPPMRTTGRFLCRGHPAR